jgi:hypothetical protein
MVYDDFNFCTFSMSARYRKVTGTTVHTVKPTRNRN